MDAKTQRVLFLLKDSLGDPGPDINQLPQVELIAREDDRLVDLSKQAFDVAGLSPLDGYTITFVSFPDDVGRRELVPYLHVGVDRGGLLFWRLGVGSTETSIGDVERAAEQGLFDGDPHAYTVDRGGYGNGGLVATWDDLTAFLKEVGGVGGGVVIVATLARSLARVIGVNLRKWLPRHARYPDTFFNSIVSRSEWDVTRLARLLDVDESEARDLLVALGYEGPHDVLRISDDKDKAHLRKRLAEQHFLWDGWHEVRKPRGSDDPPA